MSTQEAAPMPRCCRSHDDWPTLIAHLCAEFPELSPPVVVAQVLRAKRVVEDFDLDERDQVDTAELVCRSQLALRAGRAGEAARLDPQPHPGRSMQSRA